MNEIINLALAMSALPIFFGIFFLALQTVTKPKSTKARE